PGRHHRRAVRPGHPPRRGPLRLAGARGLPRYPDHRDGWGTVRLGCPELILAGAAMGSVGTAIFHDPSACPRSARELEEELASRGVARLADVIGLAHESPRRTGRKLSGNVL